ncbi:MAG: hypothetical protein QOD42_623, partial [Sphingomonadales bacterium]|nr:hypothetical protein [Sphingomonadales bacterium]
MPTYTGNNGNNTINGSSGNDTIYGLGGNDNLFGYNGLDTIWGGSGHDYVDGGSGNDTLYGESGNDELVGGAGNDTMDGGADNDEMSGGTGNDVMSGGSGHDDMSGDDNDDTMSGGSGNDEMSGGKGNDTLNGEGDDDELFGDDGNDFVLGGAGYDILFGGSGNDVMDGGDQNDELAGGTGNDVLAGGSGNDHLSGDDNDDSLSGGSGNDALFGGSGNDTLTGGGGLDLIDGGSGTDTAIYSGSLFDYTIYRLGPVTGVIHNGAGGPGSGADGADVLVWVERLQFSDVTIDLTANNAPFAFNDAAALDEDDPSYSSGSASVLDNDFDFEGDTLTVTPGVSNGTYGTLTLNSDGTYNYVVNANAQTLAQGGIGQDSFTYTVSDGSASDTANLVFSITGLNDAPVANPDSDTTGENAAILIDVLANDTDVDNGAALTVTEASAPAGQGSASVVGNQVKFDPGMDFDDLAVGESEVVLISYSIEDEHGAAASSTLTITITGTNDGPVANPDTDTSSENAILVIDVLANDSDVDNGAVLSLIAASAPPGQGTASLSGNQIEFDPGTDFDYLAAGETAVVVLTYSIEDEYGSQSSSTVTVTIEGRDEGAVNIGTEDDDVLTGTGGDDTIDGLGGNDYVFGLAGDDQINGGDGSDFLFGDADNDVVAGGNNDDSLFGGDGNDQLFGQADNDTLFGE